MSLFRWSNQTSATSVVSADTTIRSKVFPRFVASLVGRTDPVVLDLGPAVGTTVEFFRERCACKVQVEDLFATVEARASARAENQETPLPPLATRQDYAPRSVDGVLCWDLFDYLDTELATQLAGSLSKILRTGGVIYARFSTAEHAVAHYTRFGIEDEDLVRCRTYPGTPTRRSARAGREVLKLFPRLEVVELVLLQSQSHEMLLRRR